MTTDFDDCVAKLWDYTLSIWLITIVLSVMEGDGCSDFSDRCCDAMLRERTPLNGENEELILETSTAQRSLFVLFPSSSAARYKINTIMRQSVGGKRHPSLTILSVFSDDSPSFLRSPSFLTTLKCNFSTEAMLFRLLEYPPMMQTRLASSLNAAHNRASYHSYAVIAGLLSGGPSPDLGVIPRICLAGGQRRSSIVTET
ncbi:uncharacterized protein ARMOST_06314 [Armillaria ostoyae]|uniref:Uncharacterized protein n=1 Tax=Armillaria ostoyae TaxID=47428 RepID=A0A284R2M0_ARMOS|nr:uncharacterized protein ARMOST_06314 [Armillaria ostoyae]